MARGRMIDRVVILSKKINTISEGAENLYYRIYVNTDDYGRYHADPEILKGQIYTRKKISKTIIKKRLNELWNIRLINLYNDNDETYLEIVGFEKHQTFRVDVKKRAEYPKPEKFLQRSRTEPDTSRTESNRDRLSKLNEVNISKEKLSKSSYSRIKILECDIELTKLLLEKILENNPKSRVRKITDKQKEGWQNDCRLMREQDDRAVDDIKEVITWAQDDDFWHTNILSMGKLRKQWDQLILKMGKTVKNKESWAERSERKEMEAKNE